VVLASVSHVEQQDANGSLSKPDAELFFPNTDQANAENLLSFEQSPAMDQAPT
jgi:hypothetical protein